MQKSVVRVISSRRGQRVTRRPYSATAPIRTRLWAKLVYAFTSMLESPRMSETAIHPSRNGLTK